MKKKMLLSIAGLHICILVICQSTTRPRLPSKEMIVAKSYEHGSLNKPYNPQKAIVIYEELILKGDEQAMYAAAGMYIKGKGVPKNPERALLLYEKAGEANILLGTLNAAEMYDEGIGTIQNFVKARNLYKKAAEMNNVNGKYFWAYYNYKGLGGEQNYEEAYSVFNKLATEGHANAMYFTALCLRNGYGVERNIAAAKQLLLKAMANGEKQSIEEAKAALPENPMSPIVLPFKYAANFLEKKAYDYIRVNHNVTDVDIPGEYTGYAIRYDWSGQHIIEFWPVQLNLQANGNTLTGVYKDGSESMNVQALIEHDGISFSNTSFKKSDHYTLKPAVKEFRNAKLQIANLLDSTYLVGTLELYIPFRKEPEKPIKIYLNKINKSLPIVVTDNKLTIYPNPGANILQVEFYIPETSKTSLVISDLQGKVLITESAVTLFPGRYQRKFDISKLSPGTYYLKILTPKGPQIEKFIKL